MPNKYKGQLYPDYVDILKTPIWAHSQEDAERQFEERLAAAFSEFGIYRGQRDSWKRLALALLFRHVTAFEIRRKGLDVRVALAQGSGKKINPRDPYGAFKKRLKEPDSRQNVSKCTDKDLKELERLFKSGKSWKSAARELPSLRGKSPGALRQAVRRYRQRITVQEAVLECRHNCFPGIDPRDQYLDDVLESCADPDRCARFKTFSGFSELYGKAPAFLRAFVKGIALLEKKRRWAWPTHPSHAASLQENT